MPQILIALVLAGLLDNQLRGRTLWRMSILLPFVVSPVAVAIIFGSLFGDRYGLVNQVLDAVGIDSIAWHTNRLASHVAIATHGQLALDRLQRADLPGRDAGGAA